MLQKTGMVAEVHSFGFALGVDTVTIEYRVAGDGDIDWWVKDWSYVQMAQLTNAVRERVDLAAFEHCAMYGGPNVG